MIRLPADVDPECRALCEAINLVPGLFTTCSCAGHGENPMRIYLHVSELRHLPILLYYLDPCHVGFRWNCRAYTDCSMAPPTFVVESLVAGDEAYRQAAEIAKHVADYVKNHLAEREAEMADAERADARRAR